MGKGVEVARELLPVSMLRNAYHFISSFYECFLLLFKLFARFVIACFHYNAHKQKPSHRSCGPKEVMLSCIFSCPLHVRARLRQVRLLLDLRVELRAVHGPLQCIALQTLHDIQGGEVRRQHVLAGDIVVDVNGLFLEK